MRVADGTVVMGLLVVELGLGVQSEFANLKGLCQAVFEDL